MSDSDDQLEFKNLPNLLTEWKKIQEDKNKLNDEKKVINERMREQDKRAEAMQQMILTIMKKNSIGALDLKSSNARALYKKRVIKSPLGQKELKKYFSEHFKEDPEKGKKLLEFLDKKRDTTIRESLVYEKNDLE
jgi:Family of unknown function (DUF5760)